MENNKYPENYFEHYIASFSGIGQIPDEAGFEELARLYIDIEGLDTFSELIKEVQLINENNDWFYFESIVEDQDPTVRCLGQRSGGILPAASLYIIKKDPL
jgi:hypothetical protein